ncbi:MAG TPA: hypothetical protein PKW35_11695 [Nannocystaceae bacterium]|nr:hypothetical protein [Nannocystaceae bacterium]
MEDRVDPGEVVRAGAALVAVEVEVEEAALVNLEDGAPPRSETALEDDDAIGEARASSRFPRA